MAAPAPNLRYLRSHNFVICRQCHNHLALLGDTPPYNVKLYKHNWFLFVYVVNCRLDDEHEITNNETYVRVVYCKTCGSDLGFQLITLPVEDDLLREGRYFISGRKTLAWVGEDDILFYPDTGEDVTDNVIREAHISNFQAV